jgi:hypothetical protein
MSAPSKPSRSITRLHASPKLTWPPLLSPSLGLHAPPTTQSTSLRGVALAPASLPCRTAPRRAVRVSAAAQGKVKKVVLAYSGGLDTSVILKWLQETYDCEVVTFTADLGQVRKGQGWGGEAASAASHRSSGPPAMCT